MDDKAKKNNKLSTFIIFQGAVNLTVPRSWHCIGDSCTLLYGQTSAPEVVRNVVITGDCKLELTF